MRFAVYSMEHLYVSAMDFRLFKKHSQTRPGTDRLPLMPIIADQRTQQSAFVIRLTHRESYQVESMQGKAKKRYRRTYYRAAGRAYAVATIDWDSGVVTEREQFSTREQAVRACRYYFSNNCSSTVDAPTRS